MTTTDVVVQTQNQETTFCVLAKRTYRLRGDAWQPADAQHALSRSVRYDDIQGQGVIPPICHDDDLLSGLKRGTDLIVQGSAHAAKPVRSARVRVDVSGGRAKLERELLVTGDRRASFRHDGTIQLSEPEPFTVMPIRYDRAFGGIDRWKKRSEKELRFQEMVKKWTKQPTDEITTCVYHRNPVGRGFAIGDDLPRDFEMDLPNVEHEAQALTTDTLFRGDTKGWASAPLPASFDWTDHHWFPRVAFKGMGTASGLEDVLPECQTGYLPRELAAPNREVMTHQSELERFAHGASMGLIFGTWDGTERIRITGMHPTRRVLELELPGERPELALEVRQDGKGGVLVRPEARLCTVIVRPADEELVLIWRGRHPTGSILPGELIPKPAYAVRWVH